MRRAAPGAVPLPAAGARLEAAVRWAQARLERSLLVLADLTPPLRPLARHRVLYARPAGDLRGLAVRFEGFDVPVASVVADDAEAAGILLDAVQEREDVLVVTGARQLLPDRVGARLQSVDPWMVGPAAGPVGLADEGVEPVTEAGEVAHFLGRLGMRFWCPAMLRFGHAFGARSPGGDLVAFAGVNFVLDGIGYAQIGPVAAAPGERGRALGSRVLAAVRASLAAAGVRRCGVFAEAGEARLVAFYERRGFTTEGEFAFLSFPRRRPRLARARGPTRAGRSPR